MAVISNISLAHKHTCTHSQAQRWSTYDIRAYNTWNSNTRDPNTRDSNTWDSDTWNPNTRDPDTWNPNAQGPSTRYSSSWDANYSWAKDSTQRLDGRIAVLAWTLWEPQGGLREHDFGELQELQVLCAGY